RSELAVQARESALLRGRFPTAWVQPFRLQGLRDEFENAKQAEIAARHVQQELDTGLSAGTWETDPQVTERHA
ncbi:hypothetical protein ACVBEH_33550, partial [Roseateles sp. GG27B]